MTAPVMCYWNECMDVGGFMSIPLDSKIGRLYYTKTCYQINFNPSVRHELNMLKLRFLPVNLQQTE